ncbi:cardiolipin synthase [Ruminiclostridium sufflavum DSM 19573]|uniref:Cardiolipin synthase n=1 Tax=Ruminiclostridium sufflavum DSM 19573 TaxID=1121337 RepID=A0A318XLR4_9FIRM|nr:cardiolipin synthase [Ruminiclostridium sufflavum]PYG88563.1 cardiolipin synthase [Ruminiclostridium sufflavum DSM 19573]
MYTVISILIIIINIIFIIAAVFFERKKPVHALSWVLTLSLLPVAGFVLYLIFGRAYHIKKKKFLINCDKSRKYCRELHKTLDFAIYDESKFDEKFDLETKQIIKLNVNSSQSTYTNDNKVTVFTSAEEKYRQLLEDIYSARSSIHILYFIIQNDNIGKKIIGALAQKAKEGLEIRVLFDHGSKLLAPLKIYKPIIDNGGEVLCFLSNTISNYLRANFRNHRKVAVIDGKIGYIGGINIGDEYLGLNKKISPWRDTHLKITGSSVHSLQLKFFEDWLYASKKDIYFEDTEKYFMPVNQLDKGGIGIQIVSSGPDTRNEEIKRCMLKLVNSAKKKIFIQTPYFVPDSSFLESIQNAALSGVEVIIQIPAVPDKPYVYKATMSFVADVIDYGIKVYLYQGFLHSKMLVIDDSCCSIGTANIDIRSFSLNFEINAFMYGKEISQRCAEIFKEDLNSCTLLTREKYQSRSIFQKIQESIFRLLSPIL